MVDGGTMVDGCVVVEKMCPQQKCDYFSSWPESLLICFIYLCIYLFMYLFISIFIYSLRTTKHIRARAASWRAFPDHLTPSSITLKTR